MRGQVDKYNYLCDSRLNQLERFVVFFRFFLYMFFVLVELEFSVGYPQVKFAFHKHHGGSHASRTTTVGHLPTLPPGLHLQHARVIRAV